MQPRPRLSVVVPAFNEEKRIHDSLLRLAAYLETLPGPAEVIVVDDGSTDRTAAIVLEFSRGAGAEGRTAGAGVAFRLLQNERNRGKGYSVKHGVLLAAGELVLLTDADLSTPIEELPRLAQEVRTGRNAVAIGSRGLAGSRIERRQPAWRQAMGRSFNRLVRVITGLDFRDTQCGFKVMRRESVLPLFRAARVERFAYDVEILYLARKAGIGVVEIPVLWRDAPGTKVRALRDSLDMLKDVVGVVWRDRRGGYGSLGAADEGGP